jgi:hypothetical protein
MRSWSNQAHPHGVSKNNTREKKRREKRNCIGKGWRRRREICYKVQRLTHIPAVRRK